MLDSALLIAALILAFAALAGLFQRLHSITCALEAMQRNIAEIHGELAKISMALQTIKKRIANSAGDSFVDEFVEIDGDQWLDENDRRELRELKQL